MTIPLKTCAPGPLRAVLLAVALALPAAAQNARIQLQSLEKLGARASEVVDITLEGSALRMAGKFLGNDPETRQLVQGLKGIFVKSYEFDKPDAYAKAEVEAIRTQLQGPGWSRIVAVQEKGDKERTEIYVQGDPAGNPLGLVVLAMEAKALTVVNIVGSIDLEHLSAMEGKLGIPKIHKGKDLKTQGAAHEAKP